MFVNPSPGFSTWSKERYPLKNLRDRVTVRNALIRPFLPKKDEATVLTDYSSHSRHRREWSHLPPSPEMMGMLRSSSSYST